MPLPLEEIEERLTVLEDQNRVLRAKVKTRFNPFEDLTIQLALENGSTVSARTRFMNLGIRYTNNNTNDGNLDFPDALTSSCGLQTVLPADWVEGTDITFVIGVLQTATGSNPVVVWNSQISIEAVSISSASGNSFSDTNLNNDSALETALTQNETRRLSRIISGTTIATNRVSGEENRLQWVVTRQGNHASDAVNALVRFRSAWIEYTAFF